MKQLIFFFVSVLMVVLTSCEAQIDIDKIDVLNCDKSTAKCWRVTYTAIDGNVSQTQEAYEWGTEYDEAFKLKNISVAAQQLGKTIRCTMKEDKDTEQDICSAKERSVRVNTAYKELVDSWNHQL